jgi:hypothetical protein
LKVVQLSLQTLQLDCRIREGLELPLRKLGRRHGRLLLRPSLLHRHRNEGAAHARKDYQIVIKVGFTIDE